MKTQNRLVRALLVSLAASGAQHLSAQPLLIPTGSNGIQVTAAAEREGTTYQRVASSSDAAPRTCALPWMYAPAKSGEFRIGGQISPTFPLQAGRMGKIWWSPTHNTKDMPPLLVRGRNMTTMKDTVRFTISSIATPVNPGGPRTPESQRTYFFPSGTTLPTPGRWLVVATSGANWGCFVLTVVPAKALSFGR
jgi:hypothetical protein